MNDSILDSRSNIEDSRETNHESSKDLAPAIVNFRFLTYNARGGLDSSKSKNAWKVSEHLGSSSIVSKMRG